MAWAWRAARRRIFLLPIQKISPSTPSAHERIVSRGLSNTGRGIVSGALMRPPPSLGGWAMYAHGAGPESDGPPKDARAGRHCVGGPTPLQDVLLSLTLISDDTHAWSPMNKQPGKLWTRI